MSTMSSGSVSKSEFSGSVSASESTSECLWSSRGDNDRGVDGAGDECDGDGGMCNGDGTRARGDGTGGL